jgi:hypothetical protein
MDKPLRDPDWEAAIRNGFRPYHIHLKPQDVGVPQDESSAMRITEIAVRSIESWGFAVWPKTSSIDYDGHDIVVTVLVNYRSGKGPI